MARPLRAVVFAALVHGCTCNDAQTSVAEGSAGDGGLDFSALTRAEDTRKSADVPPEARTNRDVRIRRRAIRALARIADDASVDGLTKALEDEDPEVSAWAAYGLGLACKGREETTVKDLAARGAALDAAPVSTPIDPHFAIARAMGRCGGALAEQTLAAWARAGKAFADPACFGLGDIASRRGTLGDDTVTALLDAAEGGRAAAFHPLARMDRLNDAFSSRILSAARGVTTAKAADDRAFAIRALGVSGPDAAPELEAIAADGSRDVLDRIQAARALAKLGEAGRASAASVLVKIAPAKDPLALASLGGAQIHVIATLLSALGAEPPKSVEPTLYAISGYRLPGTPPASLGRRLAGLRCTAAALLARYGYDSEGLRGCDDPGTVAWETARLATLIKRPLIGERRKAWLELTKSKNLRTREAALDAIGSHPELSDPVIRTVIAEALADFAHPGLVATAAEIVHAHPEHFLVLSPKEIKKALDPRAPLNPNPEQDLDPAIAKALEAAIANKWPDDLIETRVALVDAMAAVHAPKALDHAKDACGDPNFTVRDKAAIAMRTLGESKAQCPAPQAMPVAKNLGPPKGQATKIKFSTDAGDLSFVLDGDLAPITSARVVELAKSGFYKGIACHRVVPGFVVQFGDPLGDGYGGSGTILRSETSPKPFGSLDVGVALAGRDTGSSQLFVTLSRYAHLDGEYPLIGHAEGDWAGVAEGDVINDVVVSE